MAQENIICSRPDREIRKKILKPGDYFLVPYEDSRCKIVLSNVTCLNEAGKSDIELDSRIFSQEFDGNILIGNSDFFIDRDFELLLQQMCCGEQCSAIFQYRNNDGLLVKTISCEVELKEVTEEQLVSDWSWYRLLEAAQNHKLCGVKLVKDHRITDAFRRFSKALKFVIAIEPIDPELIDADTIKEITDLKVKLYNNLAHCQLQYNEYEAALELCDNALTYEPDNAKAHYRKCIAYTGLHMYEDAWKAIQQTLKIDPNDKAALQKAELLKPQLKKIDLEYSNVIKKMFSLES